MNSSVPHSNNRGRYPRLSPEQFGESIEEHVANGGHPFDYPGYSPEAYPQYSSYGNL